MGAMAGIDTGRILVGEEAEDGLKEDGSYYARITHLYLPQWTCHDQGTIRLV